ncbi:MAG: metalloregulator ArsR/SmtB family transcription factor [Chloroflexota bacterium]
MDKQLFQRHADLCQTLANPIRLELLSHLRDGEKRVNELAELTQLNQANVSQHLSIMRSKGLVTTRREGTNIYYRITNPKIIRACDLIREVLIEQAAEHAELVGAHVTARSRR